MSTATEMGALAPQLQAVMVMVAAPHVGQSFDSLQTSLRARYMVALAHVREAELGLTEQQAAFIDANYDILDAGQDLLRCGIGRLQLAALTPEQYRAQFLLLLVALGARGAWQGELSQPSLLYLDGLALNVTGPLYVTSNAVFAIQTEIAASEPCSASIARSLQYQTPDRADVGTRLAIDLYR